MFPCFPALHNAMPPTQSAGGYRRRDGCSVSVPPPVPATRQASRESERGDSLGQARELARGGVLVEHSTGDAAHDFGLSGGQRHARGRLVATFDRGLDLLDESTDTAKAIAVDLGAAIVAADALLGLGRIGHKT